MQNGEQAVSEEEEQEILAALDLGAWEALARRRVQHYGFRFDYSVNAAVPDKDLRPFPAFCTWLLPRVVAGES